MLFLTKSDSLPVDHQDREIKTKKLSQPPPPEEKKISARLRWVPTLLRRYGRQDFDQCRRCCSGVSVCVHVSDRGQGEEGGGGVYSSEYPTQLPIGQGCALSVVQHAVRSDSNPSSLFFFFFSFSSFCFPVSWPKSPPAKQSANQSLLRAGLFFSLFFFFLFPQGIRSSTG